MTQLRRDAAYISTERRRGDATTLTAFDEEVYDVFSTPHTVISATKTLAHTSEQEADLESRVADAMLHLLQAERIELSPDS